MCLIYQAHSLFYLLSPYSRVLLEKADRSSATQDISSTLWKPWSQEPRYLTLSRTRLIEFAHFQPNYLRIVLILSYHLHLGLPSGVLLPIFADNNLPMRAQPYESFVACEGVWSALCVRCVSRGEARETPTTVTFATSCTCLARFPSWFRGRTTSQSCRLTELTIRSLQTIYIWDFTCTWPRTAADLWVLFTITWFDSCSGGGGGGGCVSPFFFFPL